SEHVFEVSFEAIRGRNYKSDIALDDIKFQDGPCDNSASLDCDFDVDLCEWKSVRGTNRYPWRRRTGSTPSRGTGPSGDSTGSTSGSYVYMETSYSRPRRTAYLVSPEVAPSSRSHCLSFFYHMYGKTMGSLNVIIVDKIKKRYSLLSTITGNQGNVWHYKEVTITSLNKYQVIFQGVRGNGYRSDIAIDDIEFRKGTC
ncbi:MAM and LDL-receptor class A domain-containing protein 1-like, partial [Exaiptasia diaphana]|uniref:MAM domain-containing protein n=1 Tax=Exaiptasia diaphana TaxID=2652724 RepID=A0A913WTE8_EXADI